MLLCRISQQNLLAKTSVHNQPLPTRFVNCIVAYFVVDPPKKIMKTQKVSGNS